MADWDADDFDPDAGFRKPAVTDKWEGEDEEDDVKDAWDLSSEEDDAKDDSGEVKAVEVKKKKPLKDRIKEKEEKRRKEIEERKAAEEEAKKKLTPEEIAAEKLRQQKVVEDADLELAKEAFGITENDNRKTIDSMNPSNHEEFEEFCKLVTEKLLGYEKTPYYVPFLENLFRDCCAGLEAEDVKRLGSTLNVLSSEKAKANKAKGKTKKKKGPAPGGLKASKRDELEDYSQFGDEYEDFM
ncbi:eukaryotic translation initiation factor 3 subunit J-A-like [Saccoglossus kowalevskii]|uniref:Eukaryotic translation initiation factor 3 subunit J n=1 Tax=Saccoglossus kowalevskii TaxID=10224 RepID=A0ABM0GIX3_SACKO|nr:PREDICTED: eukaryotic translation initiation factor 3 subunit J-A-like [Saccoglossus kowalevskii]